MADKPEKLDDALVGLLLFMRWPILHGSWQVGKITSKITPATPRLFKSFNYRCSWSDGWSNQMLRLDEYGGGDEAEYNSWVILEKGNRIAPHRLAAIQAAFADEANGSNCAIM